ncbi:MAG: hypothetical protein ABII22_02920 [Candidatus Micrarchaeota archaeon]
MKRYCPKCKKWNVFGEVNFDDLVQKQMEKEGRSGSAEELREKDIKSFSDLIKKYCGEQKIVLATRVFKPDNCAECGTKLIEKERD